MKHIQLIEYQFRRFIATHVNERAPCSVHHEHLRRGTGLFPFVGVASTQCIAFSSRELNQFQVPHLRLWFPVAGYQSFDSWVEAVDKQRAAFPRRVYITTVVEILIKADQIIGFKPSGTLSSVLQG